MAGCYNTSGYHQNLTPTHFQKVLHKTWQIPSAVLLKPEQAGDPVCYLEFQYIVALPLKPWITGKHWVEEDTQITISILLPKAVLLFPLFLLAQCCSVF